VAAVLLERSIQSVLWGSGSAALRMAMQFFAQIAFARLLGPESLGVFAVAVLIVTLSNFVADFGIAYGLIQRDEVTEQDLRFVLGIQLIMGALVSGLLFVFSTDLARLAGDESAAAFLALLGLSCFINALTAPGSNMLKRRLQFKLLGLIHLAAYFVGFVLVGFGMIWQGFGLWALVAAWLAQATVIFLFVSIYSPTTFKPRFSHPEGVLLLRYGLTVFFTNMTNWLVLSIDRLVVARLFPARETGLYSTAYNTVFNATSGVIGAIQPVLFSGLSQRVREGSLAQTYLGVLGLSISLLVPPMAMLAMVAEPFTLFLYGQAWVNMHTVLQPLAIGFAFWLLFCLSTPMLWMGANKSTEVFSQLPMLLAYVIVLPIAANIGLAAVAWSVAALNVLRCAVVVTLSCRRHAIAFAQLISSVWLPIGIVIASAAASYLIHYLLLPKQWPLGIHLLASLGAGLFMQALCIVVMRSRFSLPTKKMVRSVLGSKTLGLSRLQS
jgi:lipopolysaccharide exporter